MHVLYGGFRLLHFCIPEHQGIPPQSKLGEHAPERRAEG